MTFRDLHYGEGPFVLPNAWDVPSALAFLDAGFEAVGTTSLGVASSLGTPDGSRSTREGNLVLAARLASLPAHISIDVEDGYSDDPEAVADYVARLDVAGVNIEDSTGEKLISPQTHAAKVKAIKDRCPGLFVNARVDTYWLAEQASIPATLERAARYVEAGADGIFVPGALESSVLRELAGDIPVPLNVLITPAFSVQELADLGVRRVSTGSLPYRAAVHAAVGAAAAVREGARLPTATPYPDLQARLVRYARSAG